MLTKKIDDFLEDDNATPEQVKDVAEECLKAEMTMDTAAIQRLASQINEATGKIFQLSTCSKRSNQF